MTGIPGFRLFDDLHFIQVKPAGFSKNGVNHFLGRIPKLNAGAADRTVYQLLFNYQASQHDGGGGYLRLIRINEADGTMRHLTYSPYLLDFNRFDDPAMREDYYPYDERNEEFSLPLPWRTGN